MLATLSRWRPWVQIPPGTLDGPLVYRLRTPASQAGKMGSTPIRAISRFGRSTFDIRHSIFLLKRLTNEPISNVECGMSNVERERSGLTKWWNRQTRGAQNAVPSGVGVRLSPWSLTSKNRVLARRQFISGWSSPVVAHIHRPPGATPGPATCGRVRKPAKRPGREPGE